MTRFQYEPSREAVNAAYGRRAVSERRGNEERAVGKSPGRGARGLPERAFEPVGCPSGARCEPWVVEARPDTSHPEQALPDHRLSMEPDYGPSDVRRERLAVEQPRPGAPELMLEPAQDGGQRRRDPVDQCPVAGQPEEVGGRDEHRPGAPVRIPRGKAAHREAEDGLGDIGVAVRGGDPRGVERLGERELLVGVADAVAPGERPLLDQQAPLGVDDALLRDLEGGPAGQRVLPEPRRRTARGVVDATVGNDVERRPGRGPMRRGSPRFRGCGRRRRVRRAPRRRRRPGARRSPARPRSGPPPRPVHGLRPHGVARSSRATGCRGSGRRRTPARSAHRARPGTPSGARAATRARAVAGVGARDTIHSVRDRPRRRPSGPDRRRGACGSRSRRRRGARTPAGRRR